VSDAHDPAHHPPVGNEPGMPEDTSGVSHMVDEGAPLEPADIESANAGDEQQGDAEAEEANPLEEAHVRIAGLTDDLQRLQAEYLNYKRRVDRERVVVAENATWKALVPIVDVLDTIDRAKEAGEDDPGFHAVADQLTNAVRQSGLVRYGEPGDEFDPNLHDALSHLGTDPEVTVQTCKHIAKAGYKLGERVIRAAQVLVVDPADD
jgi:molecular chaperone GrpE